MRTLPRSARWTFPAPSTAITGLDTDESPIWPPFPPAMPAWQAEVQTWNSSAPSATPQPQARTKAPVAPNSWIRSFALSYTYTSPVDWLTAMLAGTSNSPSWAPASPALQLAAAVQVSASPEPPAESTSLPQARTKTPSASNCWTRSLPRSITYRVPGGTPPAPVELIASSKGPSNWPPCVPSPPKLKRTTLPMPLAPGAPKTRARAQAARAQARARVALARRVPGAASIISGVPVRGISVYSLPWCWLQLSCRGAGTVLRPSRRLPLSSACPGIGGLARGSAR